MSSAVAHALPPSILALFAPRPPLDPKPAMEKRKLLNYSGIAQFVGQFEDPADIKPQTYGETVAERRERVQQQKLEVAKAKVEEAAASYDPANDQKIKGDPYKTLFISRLSYETTEAKLKKDFEQFGPIKRLRLVHDTTTGKPCGYAFLEYEHERDMKTAYKQGDGKKIDGRRVLVDVERGRTVRNWRPRKLGGGLGSTRAGGKNVSVKNAGRDMGFGSVASASTPTSRPGGLNWNSETRSGGDRDRGGGDRDRGGGDREPVGSDRSSAVGTGGGGLQWSTERRDDRRTSGTGADRRDDRERRERDRERERERDSERRGGDRGDDRDRERDRRGSERDRDRDRGDRDRDRDRRESGGDRDRDRDRNRDRDRDRDRRGEDRDRDRRESGGEAGGGPPPPPPPPPPPSGPESGGA